MEEEKKEVVLPSDELEKQEPEPEEVKTEPSSEETSEGEPKDPEPKEEPKVEADAFAKYTAELSEKGDLSEESIKEITSNFKIPESVVKEYVEMAKQVRETKVREAVSELHRVAGGEESYKAMLEWARTGLSKEEQKAFDKQLDSGLENARMAVEWLQGKYLKVNAKPVHLEGKPRTGLTGYKSKEAWLKDLQDKRYRYDAEYRAKVEAKFRATTIDLS
jgi:hypothetical protein